MKEDRFGQRLLLNSWTFKGNFQIAPAALLKISDPDSMQSCRQRDDSFLLSHTVKSVIVYNLCVSNEQVTPIVRISIECIDAIDGYSDKSGELQSEVLWLVSRREIDRGERSFLQRLEIAEVGQPIPIAFIVRIVHSSRS